MVDESPNKRFPLVPGQKTHNYFCKLALRVGASQTLNVEFDSKRLGCFDENGKIDILIKSLWQNGRNFEGHMRLAMEERPIKLRTCV
jgi:hypothetical protein